jgi:hypothetical protein
MEINPQFIGRIDLRTRLRHLCFTDPCSFAGNQESSTPVYTDTEMAEEPIKWLKYLLLDRSGVESIDKIREQIRRFSLDDVGVAEAWALERMNIASNNHRQVMIVAKLVPWDQGAQLKNYRMLSAVDVGPAFHEIRCDMARGAHELWCCESDTDTSGLNLGGRLNYPRDCSIQTLELVWFASPRFIENIRIAGFEYPYLRAVRSMVNPEFSVTTMHVPKRYRTEDAVDPWRADFDAVLWLLNSRQLAMRRLVAILHQFGANEVCFCFKVTNGHLTIIDWDTEIESSDLP